MNVLRRRRYCPAAMCYNTCSKLFPDDQNLTVSVAGTVVGLTVEEARWVRTSSPSCCVGIWLDLVNLNIICLPFSQLVQNHYCLLSSVGPLIMSRANPFVLTWGDKPISSGYAGRHDNCSVVDRSRQPDDALPGHHGYPNEVLFPAVSVTYACYYFSFICIVLSCNIHMCIYNILCCILFCFFHNCTEGFLLTATCDRFATL